MTNNMKKVFLLMRYGHQATMNFLFGLGFLIWGIFAKISGMVSLGIDFLFPLMLPIFLCQMLYGLDYVKMISSADMKRWITVYMPDILVDVWVLAMLVLYYVLTEFRYRYPENFVLNLDVYSISISIPTGNIMLCAGMLAVIFMCYVAGCYKCYWISTGVFIVAMMGYGVASSWILSPGAEVPWHLTNGQGILAAFLFYVAGAVVSGAIRRLLYKIPVSTMAVGKRLGMEGKA